MKSVFRLLPFLFLLGLSAYLPGVRAETCRANIGQTTVNIPNIKYLPTLPVNTQMTSAMADNGSGIPFSCDLQLPTASAKRIVYKQLKTGGSPMVINGQHVYPSAIDGIGYALSFQCAGGPMRAIDGSHSAGGESVVVCDSATLPALMTQQQTTVRIAVTFYKTGTVQLADGTHTNSPPLPQVGEMTIEQQTSASASFVASAPVSIDIAALNVDIGSSGSCQVATSTIQVSLGTVNRGGVSWHRDYRRPGEALFDSGLLSDADRRAHRFFRRHGGERYPGAEPGQQQRQRRRREADLRQ